MDIKNLTYLLLLLVYLILPVILGFQKKVRFPFNLRYLVPATIFTGAIFVMWEKRFIELGIWHFNPGYLTGIEAFGVPLEEWLSFVIIPWSAIYIYEWLKVRFEEFEQANFFVILSLALFAGLAVLSYLYRRQLCSFFTFFLTAVYLGYTVFRNRFKMYFTKFYLACFVTLVPVGLVSYIQSKAGIIMYDQAQITGIRLLGVTPEKIVYIFLMLLINITIYEYLSARRYY